MTKIQESEWVDEFCTAWKESDSRKQPATLNHVNWVVCCLDKGYWIVDIETKCWRLSSIDGRYCTACYTEAQIRTLVDVSQPLSFTFTLVMHMLHAIGTRKGLSHSVWSSLSRFGARRGKYQWTVSDVETSMERCHRRSCLRWPLTMYKYFHSPCLHHAPSKFSQAPTLESLT